MAKTFIPKPPSMVQRNPKKTRVAAMVSMKRTYDIQRPIVKRKPRLTNTFSVPGSLIDQPHLVLARIFGALAPIDLLELFTSTQSQYFRAEICRALVENDRVERFRFEDVKLIYVNGLIDGRDCLREVAEELMVHQLVVCRLQPFTQNREYEEPYYSRTAGALVVRGRSMCAFVMSRFGGSIKNLIIDCGAVHVTRTAQAAMDEFVGTLGEWNGESIQFNHATPEFLAQIIDSGMNFAAVRVLKVVSPNDVSGAVIRQLVGIMPNVDTVSCIPVAGVHELINAFAETNVQSIDMQRQVIYGADTLLGNVAPYIRSLQFVVPVRDIDGINQVNGWNIVIPPGQVWYPANVFARIIATRT